MRLDRIGAATGGYPTYRLTVHADGSVRFDLLAMKGEAPRTERAEPRVGVSTRIGRVLDRQGFDGLPQMEIGKSPYCEWVMMDVGSTAVTVFRGAGTRSVLYGGCGAGSVENNRAEPFHRRLQEIADSIVAITDSKKWIPAPRCCEEQKPR